MDLLDIRRRLEDYTAPGSAPPPPREWEALKRDWQGIKPNTHPEYHPIIDDRITLVESMAARFN